MKISPSSHQYQNVFYALVLLIRDWILWDCLIELMSHCCVPTDDSTYSNNK